MLLECCMGEVWTVCCVGFLYEQLYKFVVWVFCEGNDKSAIQLFCGGREVGNLSNCRILFFSCLPDLELSF